MKPVPRPIFDFNNNLPIYFCNDLILLINSCAQYNSGMNDKTKKLGANS